MIFLKTSEGLGVGGDRKGVERRLSILPWWELPEMRFSRGGGVFRLRLLYTRMSFRSRRFCEPVPGGLGTLGFDTGWKGELVMRK